VASGTAAASSVRSATASSIETVMPWPYSGLKVHTLSPISSSPAGQFASRSKWRQPLAVSRYPKTAPSGCARRSASAAPWSASAATKAVQPSASVGGRSRPNPASVTIQRPPSAGKMPASRDDGIGSRTSRPFQSTAPAGRWNSRVA
jgi:hypothetical protein